MTWSADRLLLKKIRMVPLTACPFGLRQLCANVGLLWILAPVYRVVRWGLVVIGLLQLVVDRCLRSSGMVITHRR